MRQILMSFFMFALSTQSYALEVSEEAPCVVLNNLASDGSESGHCIRESNVPGQFKVLEFFSATCSICQKNLPIFSSLAKEFQSTVTFRLVGIDRDEALLRNYVEKNRELIQFETALDTERDAKRAYDVVSTPTLFVLDSKDIVVFKHTGYLSESDVDELKSILTKE